MLTLTFDKKDNMFFISENQVFMKFICQVHMRAFFVILIDLFAVLTCSILRINVCQPTFAGWERCGGKKMEAHIFFMHFNLQLNGFQSPDSVFCQTEMSDATSFPILTTLATSSSKSDLRLR